MFMSPDEILDVARKGAALGCKEVLFTLGDRPEERWPEAREWLDANGYDSTITYLRAMAIRDHGGDRPPRAHEPGRDDLGGDPAAEAGLAVDGHDARDHLDAAVHEKGEAHYGSPDKDPAVRLRVIEDAGRSNVPFTTGLLLGIGETYAERVEALFAIRAARPPPRTHPGSHHPELPVERCRPR